MKKLLFIAMLLLMASSAAAQSQAKKVAILETIDKEGNVSYGVKLMVRSNLTKAVSNAPGYEGYDRVNMSQIMGEQDFQRTGVVNEEQIKRLGEISGADYIVVSEVAKIGETDIIVTATILNVETAQTIGADNALMTTTASDIQHGCESLANRLLGMEVPNTKNTTSNGDKTFMSKIKGKITNNNTTTNNNTKTKTSENVDVPLEINENLGALVTFPDGTQGVVFYLENGRGLAVSLTERELKWDANRKSEDIIALDNIDENNHPFIYGEGEKNTLAIIQQLGTNANAANWCTTIGEGWYLPSSGELYYLMTVSKKGSPVYNKLTSMGARLDGWYWASTEHNRKEAMNISDGGTVFTEDKDSEVKVRAIRAFTE